MECWCGPCIAPSAIAWTALLWVSCRLEEGLVYLVWDASAAAAGLPFIYLFVSYWIMYFYEYIFLSRQSSFNLMEGIIVILILKPKGFFNSWWLYI